MVEPLNLAALRVVLVALSVRSACLSPGELDLDTYSSKYHFAHSNSQVRLLHASYSHPFAWCCCAFCRSSKGAEKHKLAVEVDEDMWRVILPRKSTVGDLTQ